MAAPDVAVKRKTPMTTKTMHSIVTRAAELPAQSPQSCHGTKLPLARAGDGGGWTSTHAGMSGR